MNFALCTVAGLALGFVLGRGFARDQAEEERIAFPGVAAKDEEMQFIGIEQQQEYVETALRRGAV